MAKPTLAQVIACTTKTALLALAEANAADCVDLVDCKRCKNCQQCERCIDCKNCVRCVNSRNMTDCVDCTNCSQLKNSTGCVDCHGSDANTAANLYWCSDCLFVERSFFVVGMRGTAEAPIKNQFMQLALSAEQMDILLALPPE